MSINVVPLPPKPFIKKINVRQLPAASELHRIYSIKFAGNAFNPSHEVLNRFSPIFSTKGEIVPVLYAADSKAAAIYETLFHDAHVKGSRTKALRHKVLEKKRYGSWLTQRSLTIATLHAPDLANMGLTLDQLTATDSKYYPQTARWAEAIHQNHTHIHGLEWTSYRAGKQSSFILFGDRVSSSDLVSVGNEVVIAADATTFAEVVECGERVGVRVTTTLP
jgi:RES domain